MKKYNIILIVLLIVLGLLFTYSIYNGNRYSKGIYKRYYDSLRTVVITNTDTAYIYKTDTIVVNKYRVLTKYREKIDTIYIDRSFEKAIDTTIDNVSISIRYFYPADSFRIHINQLIYRIKRVDTVLTYVTVPIYTDDNYYKINSTHFISAGIGLILGVIIGK